MSEVPLEPPTRYREELARYLRLEYGESDKDPEAIKADDLSFAGLFAIDARPTYYWAYPRSDGGRSYATVEVYANTYCLSMTPTAPDPSHRITDPSQCPPLTALDMPPEGRVPWYWRGPFKFVAPFAAVFVGLWAIVRQVRGMRRTTDTLAVLPVAEILPRWLEAMDFKANDSRAHLRPPASEAELAEAARRMGHKLPPAVADFYRVSNGISWHNALGYESLPPLAELRHGRECDPPLSARLQRYWEENERVDGEPQSVQVTKDDVRGMLNVDPVEVDFAAADGLVIMSRSDEADFLAYTVEPLGELPAGCVLQVEGTRATRYNDLAHWFAGQVAIFGSLPGRGK